ncbi:MAG: DUF2752 domain-containing protein [Ignavibacteria bacterium]|nr:DUF2752 domain-containing protein [Ignavibacteria bacterium]
MDLNKLFSNTKFYQTAVLTAAVFFITVLFVWDPSVFKYYPDCVFNSLTGLECPGCGGMRGTHFLLHLDFGKAFFYNPLVFVTTPVIIYIIIYFVMNLFFGVKLPKITLTPVLATVISAIVLLFWIYRNL